MILMTICLPKKLAITTLFFIKVLLSTVKPRVVVFLQKADITLSYETYV